MGKWIDADALIADMQERYCKPCKDKGEDYNEVRCRACWVDDAIDDVDGFADISIDIVRCRECKHMDIYVDIDDDEYFCRIHNDDVRAYDFCSYGERKESE